MAYQEGYCDGVAGAGMQHQDALCCDDTMHVVHLYQAGKAIEGDMVSDYAKGFLLGSLDRKTMLHREQLQALADRCVDEWSRGAVWTEEELQSMGLMNSTARDTMQEWRNSIEPAAEYMKRATATINRLYGLWADDAGDRNA